jgi:hypothetical protein
MCPRIFFIFRKFIEVYKAALATLIFASAHHHKILLLSAEKKFILSRGKINKMNILPHDDFLFT